MSQSLVKNLLHLVYSTKHREPWIPKEHREALWAYQAGIFKSMQSYHRKTTFQDELRALFNKHGIEFDERYVWD